MLILRVAKAFDAESLPYCVIGGFAVALHGAPRGTLDLDLMIPHTAEAFTKAEETLKAIGLTSRLPISADVLFKNRMHFITTKNLVAWGFVNQRYPVELVDIIITQSIDSVQVENISVEEYPVKVISKADLIRMKEKSGRAQDIEDVRALKLL